MAKAHAPRKRPHLSPLPEGEGTGAAQRFGWITTFALFLAIALVLARGMMLETVRDPFQVEMGSQPIPRGPGAATGLILDLLCCIPALLVLLRGAIDRSFIIHRSLAHLFMLILGVWTILSPIWASDKFMSIVTAAHWLSALVLLWAVSQLVRDWSNFRIIAAAGFGLMLVLTAHGTIYRLVELPELRQQVEQDWPTIVQERGWEPDSYIAQRFRQRVMAGEMIGFSASPNTFGAMIVMLGIVTAGLTLQRIVLRDEFGWAVVLVLALVPAAWVLFYTNSRTALATPVLAGMIFIAAWFGRELIARYRRPVFFGALLLFFAFVAAVIGHGMRHGTLFHDSLTFRWKYWIGGWRIFIEHTLAGVGFANFGLHYLGTRLPDAAEEITDPHNFIVRIFTELGLIGGITLLAWMMRLWWELTRPVLPPIPENRPPLGARPPGQALAGLLQLAFGAGVIGIIAGIDFSHEWAYSFIEVLKRSLYMLLLILGLVVGSFRSTKIQELDDRPAPLLLYAMLVALAMFLVHNLVDFSLFETGPIFVFAMLTGAALGMRMHHDATRAIARPVQLAALWIGCAAWVAGGIGMAAPIVIAEREAHRGDEALRAGAPAMAADHFRVAYETLWLPNGDYALRATRALIMASAPPQQVRPMLERAIDASPMTGGYVRMRAEYELRQPSPDVQQVIADFERVIELDPHDISAHLDYARALEFLARRDEARRQYEQALRLNDLLHPDEPERLPPTRIEQIRERIRSLSH